LGRSPFVRAGSGLSIQDANARNGEILVVLGAWGPCETSCCLADLDGDGSVGVSALLVMLANWGPCP